jgi:putative intracellular protease/amidase
MRESALLALLPLLAASQRAQAQATEHMGAAAHGDMAAIPGLKMYGKEKVALLLYPGFTALDLVGPHYFLACMMGATVDLVTTGGDLAPVASDLALAIQPTVTLAKAAPGYDLLMVPGGTMGTLQAMQMPAVLDWLSGHAGAGALVTSVCTGSLVLGAAGLLRGRRATSHWAALSSLKLFGATPVEARIVTDGRIVTGAGVSAGLDFALRLVGELRGEPYAQALMLQAEYVPDPPYPGGTLATTPPAVRGPMEAMLSPFAAEVARVAPQTPGGRT